MDLATFITKAGCECLNESDDHTLDGCLTSNSAYLESDCDEQVCPLQIQMQAFVLTDNLFQADNLTYLQSSPKDSFTKVESSKRPGTKDIEIVYQSASNNRL